MCFPFFKVKFSTSTTNPASVNPSNTLSLPFNSEVKIQSGQRRSNSTPSWWGQIKNIFWSIVPCGGVIKKRGQETCSNSVAAPVRNVSQQPVLLPPEEPTQTMASRIKQIHNAISAVIQQRLDQQTLMQDYNNVRKTVELSVQNDAQLIRDPALNLAYKELFSAIQNHPINTPLTFDGVYGKYSSFRNYVELGKV